VWLARLDGAAQLVLRDRRGAVALEHEHTQLRQRRGLPEAVEPEQALQRVQPHVVDGVLADAQLDKRPATGGGGEDVGERAHAARSDRIVVQPEGAQAGRRRPLSARAGQCAAGPIAQLVGEEPDRCQSLQASRGAEMVHEPYALGVRQPAALAVQLGRGGERGFGCAQLGAHRGCKRAALRFDERVERGVKILGRRCQRGQRRLGGCEEGSNS